MGGGIRRASNRTTESRCTYFSLGISYCSLSVFERANLVSALCEGVWQDGEDAEVFHRIKESRRTHFSPGSSYFSLCVRERANLVCEGI